MSINDALPAEWDQVRKDRYTDNRSPDPVNSPTHYTHGGGIECIDAIDAMLGREGSLHYYEGTMMKYLWRWRHKGGLESLLKMRWFLDRMISTEQGG